MVEGVIDHVVRDPGPARAEDLAEPPLAGPYGWHPPNGCVVDSRPRGDREHLAVPDPDERAVDTEDALSLDHDDPQDLGPLDGLGEALGDREDVVDALGAPCIGVVV